MNFEEQLVSSLKQKVISDIKDFNFIQLQHSQRQPLPQHFIDDLWMSVDWNKVISAVKPEIEKRICNSIIGAMETEVKTDIKKLMSVDGVREKLRIEVYPKLMAVIDAEK